jgi:uncharacterized membrane protein
VIMQNFVLAWHLCVIAVGVGLTLSNFWNTHLSTSHGEEFQKGLALQRRSIGRIGDGVISLIWITGGLALWLRGLEGLGEAFWVKIGFVLVLTLVHIKARKLGEQMRREGHRNFVQLQGQFMLGGFLSALIAIVCAVLAFAT